MIAKEKYAYQVIHVGSANKVRTATGTFCQFIVDFNVVMAVEQDSVSESSHSSVSQASVKKGIKYGALNLVRY